MATALKIKSVSNQRELRQFIYLPAKIHKNHQKVPPIYVDEWKYFNLKKNRYTAYSASNRTAKSSLDFLRINIYIKNHLVSVTKLPTFFVAVYTCSYCLNRSNSCF
jgi:hypothetical protein